MSDRRELQHKMDVEKWLESETRHFDMCGSSDYGASPDQSDHHPRAHALPWPDKSSSACSVSQ